MKIEAVVFDMDGVLLDSEPMWRRAERERFGARDVELSEADCMTTMGMRIDQVVDYWFERRPWPEGNDENQRRALAEEIVARVEELVRSEGVPLPGVPEALAFCRRQKLRIGLATSSAQSLIQAVFDALDLYETFEIVCSAVDERHGKPAPDVYLSAIRGLGVAAERALAIEDSVAGVESARAAGMATIAIPAEEARSDPRFEQADLVLDSLLGLDREALSRASDRAASRR
jgi:sugar-phosphatase